MAVRPSSLASILKLTKSGHAMQTEATLSRFLLLEPMHKESSACDETQVFGTPSTTTSGHQIALVGIGSMGADLGHAQLENDIAITIWNRTMDLPRVKGSGRRRRRAGS
ncbi:hypothetical protein JDV02_001466 [Purpureocillium takamizusanense]|uniref:6-phosphogluconate dehydrogenase NADP-binding domain-containing protein n=1 Tax=Purpureocillium takamizusanense TaxID=2060973 RepID=A0A9Q8V6H2_9HYPO|nr:uncharacterized protein JDV02_001466 [Purpureocillium takamizusanense]UNI14885.1 hypothetical protein JDV02_001466 [Purpureocillium takamizusanense]